MATLWLESCWCSTYTQRLKQVDICISHFYSIDPKAVSTCSYSPESILQNVKYRQDMVVASQI